jgi:hypothetical protein
MSNAFPVSAMANAHPLNLPDRRRLRGNVAMASARKRLAHMNKSLGGGKSI